MGNTNPGNQGYVMKCKRYFKYDSSNKSSSFDVDGFSQHSRSNYLQSIKWEKHVCSECRHSTNSKSLTNDKTCGVCLTIYEDIMMDCFYIKGGQGCHHHIHHPRLS